MDIVIQKLEDIQEQVEIDCQNAVIEANYQIEEDLQTSVLKLVPRENPENEIFISYVVAETKGGSVETFAVVATTQNMYKMDACNRNVVWKKDIREISIREWDLGNSHPTADDEKAFRLSYPSNTGVIMQKVKGAMQALPTTGRNRGESVMVGAQTHLQANTVSTTSEGFACDSKEERDIFVTLVNRLSRDAWQLAFESSFYTDAREIYQAHYALTKVNEKGKPQDRWIVLSTNRLANFLPVAADQKPSSKHCKWSYSYEKLAKITVSKSNPCGFSLWIISGFALKKKVAYHYTTSDTLERREILSEIFRLHNAKTKEELLVEFGA